jgi:integrase
VAKDIPSKKYKGVYYRHLKSGDRSYFIILRVDGKQKRISVGKKSEGITEAFCYQQKINIINSEKFGGEQAAILQKKQKKDPTFRELFDYFLESGPAKSSTKRMMQYLINQVSFADQRRVTTQDIINFKTEIAKDRAPNTVDSKVNLLSSVFKFAIDSGRYRYENPCKKVKRNNINDNRERYLSQDEVDTLLADVKDNDLLYLFTKLAMCTGARVGTLMMIRPEHIKGENIRLFNIKTGRFYMGWIDAETQELLKGRIGYVLSWDDPERKPDAYQYQWRMQRRFNRLFNQGVTDSRDKVVTHTLRHTVASLLVQNGAPLQVVQKVLDHKSIRSTERYAKLNQDNIKSELNRLWK